MIITIKFVRLFVFNMITIFICWSIFMIWLIIIVYSCISIWIDCTNSSIYIIKSIFCNMMFISYILIFVQIFILILIICSLINLMVIMLLIVNIVIWSIWYHTIRIEIHLFFVDIWALKSYRWWVIYFKFVIRIMIFICIWNIGQFL